MVTLRWSIYNENEQKIDMLKTSILSFQKFLPDFKYIVTAQNPQNIPEIPNTEIIQQYGYFATDKSPYAFRKWAPFRVTDGIEIYCDYDIFCVREPKAILQFIESNAIIMIQVRKIFTHKDTSGYGIFAKEINSEVPLCCNGFVGMKENFFFDEKQIIEDYWKCIEKFIWTNEQGSMIKSIQNEILNNKCFYAHEKYIKYGHPTLYPIDFDNLDADIYHLIGSPSTNYHYFNIMKQIFC